MNKSYDFKSEIEKIYGSSNSKSIIKSLDIVYEHLPIMVETKWGTLGVHGGIPEFNNKIEEASKKKESDVMTV